MSTTYTNDIDITLTAGDIRLTVSPAGASLRGLSRHAGGDPIVIVTEYRGAANKVAGQGDVLIPFPGRIKDGAYRFEGVDYQLPRNDQESPSAIHGFLREATWTVLEQTESRAVFGTRLDAAAYASKGYPFSLDVRLAYTATEHGTESDVTITNYGDRTAPVAAGFHPYFTVGTGRIDGNMLTVPFESTLEMDGFIPTGRVLPVEGTPFDFRTPRVIGDTRLNTCFVDPTAGADGLTRVVLSDPATGRAVTVWMDASFGYAVLYSGDPLPESLRRTSLAIEPMTCGSDAFNHPDWGLVALPPSTSFRGRWGVSAE
ncbi:MAG: hypothetical protein ACLQVD_21115 [Capsulimonadaceae bacterium]